jgi:hypothetical protein
MARKQLLQSIPNNRVRKATAIGLYKRPVPSLCRLVGSHHQGSASHDTKMTFGCWPKDYFFREVGAFPDATKPDHPKQEPASLSMTFIGCPKLSHGLC